MAAASLAGTRVGRFRLGQRLGEGSTGAVFLATPAGAAGRVVALKVLHPELVAQPGFAVRLDREIRVISALGSPHILPVYEYGTGGSLTYVVMPIAAGGSLRDRLRSGPLSASSAWSILNLVGDGLHRAHEAGVVHRDVKPANVMFDGYGKALIADFALAPTRLGFAVGTPGYMAPEQAKGEVADRRADVYGLAVLAFEMLTGTPPYTAASPAELLLATVRQPIPSAHERCPDVPAGLDGALLRGLAKSREHRYQNVRELVWALSRVLAGPGQHSERRRQRLASRAAEPLFAPAVVPGRNGALVAGQGEERAPAGDRELVVEPDSEQAPPRRAESGDAG